MFDVSTPILPPVVGDGGQIEVPDDLPEWLACIYVIMLLLGVVGTLVLVGWVSYMQFWAAPREYKMAPMEDGAWYSRRVD